MNKNYQTLQRWTNHSIFEELVHSTPGLARWSRLQATLTRVPALEQPVFSLRWDSVAKKITPASDPKQCVGGQQQKIRYISLRQPPNTRHRDKSQENCLQDICLCLLYTSYLKILCRSHVSDSCRTGHQWGSATRSTSSDSCLNIFVSQAPLQDPCLWIHVSASMWPCVSQDPLQDPCCRIHSSAAICISGSATRSTSSDSCLSIFVSHGCSARSTSTSPDSCLSIFISQDPLQDPCLRIHVSDSGLSIHMYLRNLCKIHVSGSVYKHPNISQDPLQDPCLRFMSQHLYTSGSSARSMSSDSCLSIHMYLRNLCKIHVSGSVYKHSYVSQAPLQDPCLRIRISASICISGSSARSMSPDPYISPCLRIHVSASSNLRILCKIHVSDSCLSIHVSAS